MFSLFWNVTQRRLAVVTDISVENVGQLFRGQDVSGRIVYSNLEYGKDTLSRNISNTPKIDIVQ